MPEDAAKQGEEEGDDRKPGWQYRARIRELQKKATQEALREEHPRGGITAPRFIRTGWLARLIAKHNNFELSEAGHRKLVNILFNAGYANVKLTEEELASVCNNARISADSMHVDLVSEPDLALYNHDDLKLRQLAANTRDFNALLDKLWNLEDFNKENSNRIGMFIRRPDYSLLSEAICRSLDVSCEVDDRRVNDISRRSTIAQRLGLAEDMAIKLTTDNVWEDAKADWNYDTYGTEQMTKAHFCKFIYNVVDVWTLTTDREEYTDFLRRLINNVTQGTREGTCKLRPIQDIHVLEISATSGIFKCERLKIKLKKRMSMVQEPHYMEALRNCRHRESVFVKVDESPQMAPSEMSPGGHNVLSRAATMGAKMVQEIESEAAKAAATDNEVVKKRQSKGRRMSVSGPQLMKKVQTAQEELVAANSAWKLASTAEQQLKANHRLNQKRKDNAEAALAIMTPSVAMLHIQKEIEDGDAKHDIADSMPAEPVANKTDGYQYAIEEYNRAISCFENDKYILRYDPHKAVKALYGKAQCLRKTGKGEASIGLLQQCLRLDQKDACGAGRSGGIWNELGSLLLLAKRPAQAAAAHTRALHLNPHCLEFKNNLELTTAYLTGSSDEIAETIHTAEEELNNEIYGKEKPIKDALERRRRGSVTLVTTVGKQGGEEMRRRATKMLRTDSESQKQYIELLEAAIGLYKAEAEDVWALYGHARALEGLQKYQEALEVLEKAEQQFQVASGQSEGPQGAQPDKSDKNPSKLWQHKCLVLIQLARPAEAVEAASKAIEVVGGYGEDTPLKQLAIKKCERLKQLAEAFLSTCEACSDGNEEIRGDHEGRCDNDTWVGSAVASHEIEVDAYVMGLTRDLLREAEKDLAESNKALREAALDMSAQASQVSSLAAALKRLEAMSNAEQRSLEGRPKANTAVTGAGDGTAILDHLHQLGEDDKARLRGEIEAARRIRKARNAAIKHNRQSTDYVKLQDLGNWKSKARGVRQQRERRRPVREPRPPGPADEEKLEALRKQIQEEAYSLPGLETQDPGRTPWQQGPSVCDDLMPPVQKRALMDEKELRRHRNFRVYDRASKKVPRLCTSGLPMIPSCKSARQVPSEYVQGLHKGPYAMEKLPAPLWNMERKIHQRYPSGSQTERGTEHFYPATY